MFYFKFRIEVTSEYNVLDNKINRKISYFIRINSTAIIEHVIRDNADNIHYHNV